MAADSTRDRWVDDRWVDDRWDLAGKVFKEKQAMTRRLLRTCGPIRPVTRRERGDYGRRN